MKRTVERELKHYGNIYYLPEYVTYPDSRAFKWEQYINDNGTYYKVFEYDLKTHDRLNLSYYKVERERKTRLTVDKTFINIDTVKAGTPVTTIENATNVNLLNLLEPGKVKASEIANPIYFDAAKTYLIDSRLSSTVTGFAVSSIETSDGQFGQYPLYVFTNAGIYALEQTGDPEVAFGRLTPISQFHYLDNDKSVATIEDVIIFANKTGIYTLIGRRTERISDPIYGDDLFNEGFANGIVMGYNKEGNNREVIISNGAYDYSLVYNSRYEVWYKITQPFKVLFHDHPDLYGITPSNTFKDFTAFNDEDVAIELRTKPMFFDDPYTKKKLIDAIFRVNLKKVVTSPDISIALKGYDRERDLEHIFFTRTYDSLTLDNPVLKSLYGSIDGYILDLSGTISPSSKILNVEVTFKTRKTRRLQV